MSTISSKKRSLIQRLSAIAIGLILLVPNNTLQSQDGKTQSVKTLLLEDAVAQALDRNFNIRVEKLEPEIAHRQIDIYKGMFDPSVEFSLFLSNQQQNKSTEDFYDYQQDVFDFDGELFSAGINGELPWGTTYGFEFQNRSSKITYPVTDALYLSAKSYTTTSEFSLSQPLLRNFNGRQRKTQIRVARKGYDIAAWQLKAVITDIITDTIYAYNNLYFADRNLDVALRSKSLAQKLLEDNQKRVKAGSIAPLDIVVAEAELALRNERVIEARRVRQTQENRLKQLISSELFSLLKTKLVIKQMPEPNEIKPDVYRDFEYCLKNRPDYREIILRKDISTLQRINEKNRSLPAMDLQARFKLEGGGNSRSSSFSAMRDQQNKSYSIGAVFQQSIPNRAGRAQSAIARLNENRYEILKEQFEQSILLELDDSATGILADWERINAARHARELAEKSLQAEEKKLSVGTSTTFVVLQLQEDLANAQVREILAMTDYNKSLAEYDRVMGRTLEIYNVITPEE